MTALQTAVLDLADARDFAFAGGKAVNLAELLGAGFPVPDGFCVGTPAYAQAAGDRRDRRACSTTRAPTSRPGPAAALLATPIPDDVAAAVTAAYTALGDGGAGRGAVVGHGRGPARAPASRVSRTPTSTWSASTRCSTRCAAAGRRSGRTGPWPTAPTRASTARGHAARRGGAADGRRAGRGRAVHRRPDQRPAHPQRDRRRAGARRGRRLRRGRPRPLVVESTGAIDRPAQGRRRARGGLPSTDRPGAASCVELGRRVEAHFGAPQDIEWALDGDGRAVAHPVPRDHHAVPACHRAQAGPARAPQRSAWPRA